MKRYNPSEIEPKWQQIWTDDQRYKAPDASDKPKYYVTGMFPYPSGAGMHTGHFMEHSIVDGLARFRRALGHNVMYPMGFDSFGLPAENYAIKTGKKPQETTATNIANFKNQLRRVGASIDWSREVNTADPAYYKWTQWVFTQLFERGLAYQKEANQWWCPKDKTVLANEQVEGGKCWRCESVVVKKPMKQWFFKITDYADALLEEIPALDWPEKIKTAQTNWIGRSEGAEIQFSVLSSQFSEKKDASDSLKFTPELTRMILDGKKTSTIRLDAKNLAVGDTAEFLTRDGDEVTPFGYATITEVRSMKLREIPNDLEGRELLRDDAHKLVDYRNYYGDSVTLDTNFTIYDFDFIQESRTKNQELSPITVFTTRPDTIFGATFMVLAPEHPRIGSLVTDDTREMVESYVAEAIKKSEIERGAEGKEKTGVFTGSYAINPVNGEKIPIWIADYVLWGYGTGAVMGVPAHDERDLAFAEKYSIPVVEVVVESLLDRKNPPREGKENTKRNVAMCVIEHPTDGTYLTLKWRKLPWHGFVMGGIEDGETLEEAARREIKEETGYTDLTLIEMLPIRLNSVFYAAHKDVNRSIITHIVRFKLNSLTAIETAREEHEDFDVVWTEQADLAKLEPVSELGHILKWLHGEKLMHSGEGVLINSGAFDGMQSSEAREEVVAWLEQQGLGHSKTTYKMRDWLISRQRYWGAPIPIIHCDKHGAVAVPEKDLPVLLPDVDDFEPKGDGKSPLARQDDWVNTTCPTCGKPAKRETDVMDGYACSSWYLLRYADPNDDKQAWKPELASYWTPLDMYVGGDHAVAHLLYVRFWNHVFYDMKLVPSKEPVKKLVYHGLIQAEDGRKMSKSLGNTIDPLEVIDAGYGADALRTFELFLGPINEDSNWSSKGIAGVYRFLNRAWTLTQEYASWMQAQAGDSERGSAHISSHDAKNIGADSLAGPAPSDLRAEHTAGGAGNDGSGKQLASITHATIKKVTDDLHRLSFNTAIAVMMELVNELYKLKLDGFSNEWQETIESLAKLLQPFAPHMTAELWQQLGHETQLDFEPWPTWDESRIVSDTMTIIVQVNGKVRAKLEVDADASEEAIKKLALTDENVKKYVTTEPKKVIYIKGKLISVVL